jgi:hypothetical protein
VLLRHISLRRLQLPPVGESLSHIPDQRFLKNQTAVLTNGPPSRGLWKGPKLTAQEMNRKGKRARQWL